jgi:hypothetical protein
LTDPPSTSKRKSSGYCLESLLRAKLAEIDGGVAAEGGCLMDDHLFQKEAAFFPFVSAEIFFEAESDVDELDFDNNLDTELDEILATSDLT